MTPFFILFILSTILSLSRPFLTNNLAFYECEDNPQLYSMRHCIQDCDVDYITSNKIRTTIWKTIREDHLLAGTCQLVSRQTVLEQNWMWFKYPPITRYEYISPTYEGCVDTWKSRCQQGPCLTREPSLPSDYTWGAAREYHDEYHLLDISPRVTQTSFDNGIMINTPYGWRSREARKEIFKDGMFIWELNSNDDMWCTLTPSTTDTCYLTSQDHIYCPKLGLTLSQKEKIKICDKDYLTDGKVTYTISDDINDLDGPIVFVDSAERNSQIISTLKELFTIKDKTACFNLCPTLQTLDPGNVIIIGTKMIKKSSPRRFSRCQVLPNCNVVIPIETCHSGELLMIDCDSHKRWWNVSEGMEVGNSVCKVSKSSNSSEIMIPIEDEMLVVNRSGYFWKGPDLVKNSGMNIINLHQTEVAKLKEGIGYHHTDVSESHPTRRSDSISSRLQFMKDVFGGIYEFICSLFSNLFFYIMLIIMVIGLAILFIIMGSHKNKGQSTIINITPIEGPSPTDALMVHE